MTLHFSQILFTEGRTFICLVPFTSSIALYVRPAAGVSLSCPDDLQSPQTNAAGSGLYYLPRRRSVRSLLVAIGDAAPREIVWRQLDDHLVTREYPDVVHAHLARDVREHLVAVLELNAEHRVGQRFDHGAFELDGVVALCQTGLLLRAGREAANGEYTNSGHERPAVVHSIVSTYGPASVIATVCSKCAESFPSAVTTVHPSS